MLWIWEKIPYLEKSRKRINPLSRGKENRYVNSFISYRKKLEWKCYHHVSSCLLCIRFEDKMSECKETINVTEAIWKHKLEKVL